MRRRSASLISVALTAPLVLGGCGGGHPAGRTDPPVTTAPTSTPAPVWSGSLAGFPLDLGYPHVNGDDGSRVVVLPEPATRRFELCRRTAWDPATGPTAVIGVTYRGESEYARGRTLALYPHARAARRVVARARGALASCAREPGGKGQGTAHTRVDASPGDSSLVWTDTFYSMRHGVPKYDTGLVVYEVTAVGRAVLLSYEYSEANGTPTGHVRAVDRFVRRERGVLARMRSLSRGSSGSRA